MRGAKQDLQIRQGADFRLAFQLLATLPQTTIDGVGNSITTPGEPISLAGLTFRAQFRAVDVAGEVEAELLAANFAVEQRGNEETGFTDQVVMHLPNAMTAAMTAPAGVYDIEAVDATANEVIEVLYGTYILALEATRTGGTP